MTVVVTGFEPFEGSLTNVSGDIADALDGAVVAGHTIVGAVLPVVQGVASEQLKSLLDTHKPDVFVGLGYAQVSSSLRLERTAINMDDYRIPDNAGNQPVDERIFDDAPDAYFSTLPIKRATAAIRDAGIPAHVNESAGAYLCNHVFFAGLHYAHRANHAFKSGFVHVPPDEKLAGDNTGTVVPLDKQVDAIKILIELALTTDGDDKLVGLGKGWE